MSNNIGIILARGGSKRIKRKNIKHFLGKSVIQYTIEAAKKSGCFSEIMISTDDAEIAELAQRLGATFPFKRSESTSNDFSSTSDVLLEVLTEFKARGLTFNNACCMYAASPFISSDNISLGLKKMKAECASSLIPVVASKYSIWRALEINKERLSRIWPENESTRTQDLPVAYFDVGQFYWINIFDFWNEKAMLTKNTAYLELKWNESHDIDTPEDWAEAEYKYQLLSNTIFEKNALL